MPKQCFCNESDVHPQCTSRCSAPLHGLQDKQAVNGKNVVLKDKQGLWVDKMADKMADKMVYEKNKTVAPPYRSDYLQYSN